jgi:hypothetical protein
LAKDDVQLWPITIYMTEQVPKEWFHGKYIMFPPVGDEWSGEVRLRFECCYFTRGDGTRYYYYVPIPPNLELRERE